MVKIANTNGLKVENYSQTPVNSTGYYHLKENQNDSVSFSGYKLVQKRRFAGIMAGLTLFTTLLGVGITKNTDNAIAATKKFFSEGSSSITRVVKDLHVDETALVSKIINNKVTKEEFSKIAKDQTLLKALYESIDNQKVDQKQIDQLIKFCSEKKVLNEGETLIALKMYKNGHMNDDQLSKIKIMPEYHSLLEMVKDISNCERITDMYRSSVRAEYTSNSGSKWYTYMINDLTY